MTSTTMTSRAMIPMPQTTYVITAAMKFDNSRQFLLRPLTSHSLVRKSQELTERIWKNIEPKLIPLMTELKGKRLERIHVQLLITRHSLVGKLLKAYSIQRSIADIIPGLADVCEMPVFKKITWDTPMDVEVTEDDFLPAMLTLPQLIDQWRDETDTKLLRIMDPSAELEKHRDRLALATTVFHCTGCAKSIAYPRILVHGCMSHFYRAQPNDGLEANPTLHALWKAQEYQTWNFANDSISLANQPRVRGAIETITKACNLDPKSTTAQEMDELDARLECVGCCSSGIFNRNPDERFIMDWRTAVSYQSFECDHLLIFIFQVDSLPRLSAAMGMPE